MLYDPVENGRVICHLCRHFCKILPERWGICGVRKNIGGKLYTFVYENPIALHVDPIEKKPLFHVFPGTGSFSIATVGCNFHCDFCQNADIAQVKRSSQKGLRLDAPRIEGSHLSVEQAVDLAVNENCKTIAYTYTEPTVFFEYAYDMSRLAVQKGLANVFVTNGYMSDPAIDLIAPYLHAANVDLKGWDQDFYKKKIGARLDGVLASLKKLKQSGVWLEVTTLVVPGYVDDEAKLRDIARFIVNELGPETPWHISRFFPHHRMRTSRPTSISVLKRAREIGFEEGLRYVYTGNIPGDEGEHTFCYHCGELLIERWGFQVMRYKIRDGKCPRCGAQIDGLGL